MRKPFARALLLVVVPVSLTVLLADLLLVPRSASPQGSSRAGSVPQVRSSSPQEPPTVPPPPAEPLPSDSVLEREFSGVPTHTLMDRFTARGLMSHEGAELVRRLGLVDRRVWHPQEAEIEDADTLELVRRIASGLPEAPVGSRVHLDAYYALAVFSRGRLLDLGPIGRTAGSPSAALEAAILACDKLPAQVSLRTRPAWPAGSPIWIELQQRVPWPWPAGIRVHVSGPGVQGEPLMITAGGFAWNPPKNLVGPDGSGTVTFSLQVDEYRQWEPAPTWVSVSQLKVDVPFRFDNSGKPMRTPVTSPEIDAMLKQFVYTVGRGFLLEDPASTQVEETRGIAFGVIMDFVLDGEVIVSDRAWWSGGRKPEFQVEHPLRREWIGDTSGKPNPWFASVGQKWTIRFKSDPDTAMRVIDAQQYWQGQVEIPLDIK